MTRGRKAADTLAGEDGADTWGHPDYQPGASFTEAVPPIFLKVFLSLLFAFSVDMNLSVISFLGFAVGERKA